MILRLIAFSSLFTYNDIFPRKCKGGIVHGGHVVIMCGVEFLYVDFSLLNLQSNFIQRALPNPLSLANIHAFIYPVVNR